MGEILRVVYQITILYLFYYIGLWIQKAFHLPIPGSIMGMLLLFLLLLTKKFKAKWIHKGASFMLSHLPLLFVPVTVGVVEYLHLFKGRGLFSVLVVVISTFLVMVASAMISQWIAIKKEAINTSLSYTGKREEL
ncbi:CidA/LrgA family protein [Calidifontibacillus oryziterrae]|uniref:CidA/LrgA family protein n=1 Tax=Calidifontibacillus oryziterrae TaxID=1191699 RepID=UPI0003174ED2|nr:CidA/LrgA family holin-like protein [Calidifontibacillus oryziterrae]